VVFDEQCGNTNLRGCGGTLGVGGPRFSSQTNLGDDGTVYYDITSGGVAVSGDATCLSPEDYILLLTHEITHALGFGHISAADGPANINPLCCNDILELDRECVNAVYEPSVALPVELISFSGEAQSGNTALSWSTASETNNAGFDVQRSHDGTQFETLSFVNGMGTTNEVHNYTLIDYNPRSGTNYYRLVQQDFDGAETASEVIAINHAASSAESVRVVPNPVGAMQRLQLVGLSDDTVEIRLIDAAGRNVYSASHLSAGGRVSFEVPNVAQGLYYLETIGDGALHTELLSIK